jgi:hypothetical protein
MHQFRGDFSVAQSDPGAPDIIKGAVRTSFVVPLFLALVPGPRAHGFDQRGNEGLFRNTGSHSLYCYKDIDTDSETWTICYTTLLPGQTCRADAVGPALRGPVYKIPNHSSFSCHVSSADAREPECSANNGTSAVLIKLAMAKHLGGYEGLGWDRFYSLMTGGRRAGEVPLRSCGSDWTPHPAVSCPAERAPLDSAMVSLAPAAAVLPLARDEGT